MVAVYNLLIPKKDPVPELDELRKRLTEHTELQNKKVLFVQDKKVPKFKDKLLDERQCVYSARSLSRTV